MYKKAAQNKYVQFDHLICFDTRPQIRYHNRVEPCIGNGICPAGDGICGLLQTGSDEACGAGFTGLAKDILRKYLTQFIPAAHPLYSPLLRRRRGTHKTFNREEKGTEKW